ncbi:MAG TPA: tetratricopeptide repeat protein [Chitinophagales bacterium]|nr:tetratricopeptide repeat protein [Chitinophagales bacterium]
MAPSGKKKAKVSSPKANQKIKSPARASSRFFPILCLTGILVITYALYADALSYGFTNWDDDVYVTESSLIHHPENTMQMITTEVGGNYHPLTMYSLAMDYKRTVNLPAQQQAKAFHFTNLFIHLLNVVLVFFFMRVLTKGRLWVSLVCALFFAIHPMHVESVAWVAERKDVLYTFFFLIALITYLRYLDRKQFVWLLVCLASFVLSAASKPAAVVLPITLWAIDYFRGRKIDVGMITEKIPFLLISVAAGILTIKAQQQGGAIDITKHYTFFQNFIFASYATMMYFIKLVYPFSLSNLYPYPNVEGRPIPLAYDVAPLIVATGLAAILYFGRKQRVILFGVAFFFINIILVLQFFTVGQAIIADRYTYVPYLGLFMIMAWWLEEKENPLRKFSIPLKPILTGVLAFFTVIFMMQTFQRVKVWKDSETLWSDAIEKFPHRILVAYNNRGIIYRHQKKYDQALADFNEVLKLNSKYELAWGNKGNIYFDLDRNDSAIANYNRALALKPEMWETLANRGTAKAKTGDYHGAIKDLSESLVHFPTNTSSWQMRALTYFMMKDFEKSIADDRKVIVLDPRDDESYNEIGVSLQNLNRYKESIPEFDKAIEIAPEKGSHYLNRSYSWNALREKQKAIDDVKKAQALGIRIPSEYLQQLNLK